MTENKNADGFRRQKHRIRANSGNLSTGAVAEFPRIAVEKIYRDWQLSPLRAGGIDRPPPLCDKCRTCPLCMGLGPDSASFFARSITPPSHPFFVAVCGMSVSLVARHLFH
jgi:hypothetical protein